MLRHFIICAAVVTVGMSAAADDGMAAPGANPGPDDRLSGVLRGVDTISYDVMSDADVFYGASYGAAARDVAAMAVEFAGEPTGADTPAAPLLSSLRLAPTSFHVAPDTWTNVANVRACANPLDCDEASSRLDVRFNGNVEGVRFGALVRFGENFSAPRRSGSRGWYIFAAADAQAVTWKLDGRAGEVVRLEEKSLVGDAQAGVAIEVGGGDLAFGFVHREFSYEGYSANEQFGGVTFAITR